MVLKHFQDVEVITEHQRVATLLREAADLVNRWALTPVYWLRLTQQPGLASARQLTMNQQARSKSATSA